VTLWDLLKMPANLDQILNQLQTINKKLDVIMSQQDDITADAAAIETAIAALAAEIAALKTANPALDLTGLDKAVADLGALAAPPAA
jgi:predicted negative regulator of RcsB-dependent stress response